ncbi:MAG: AAA family ATPase [Rhizobiales bacterium]|nr:AAA family ATPase [Hyphomicrobiales bacterium]
MTTEATPAARTAHVIVLGNEKGGSGKTTTAMHIAVALLRMGYRVATVDTDSRQRSLTRYVENRARRAAETGLALGLPGHFVVKLGEGEAMSAIQAQEFSAYVEIIDRIENAYDFVVVDTPASDSYLMRLSHSMADTLVTPINDSFVDLDVLGRIDPHELTLSTVSHYAELVRSSIRHRRLVDGRDTDWIVVRNRLSTLFSRNQTNVIGALRQVAATLGFRVADGITERVIFRELFPIGVTVFDTLDRKTLGVEPRMSHLSARREIRELIASLRLPVAAAAIGRQEAAVPEATAPAAAAVAS